MMKQAEPYKNKLLGLGLDSRPEEGNPPSKYKLFMQKQKKKVTT